LASSKLLRLLTAVAFALVAAAACDERYPAPLATPPAPVLFDARPSNTTCLAPRPPVGRVRLEPFIRGFYRPLAMVDRPDRGLVYVAEMTGRVKAYDRATGQISTALDLVGKVGTYFEQGLLGLALHPTKPYAYVTVERDADATTPKDNPNRSEILRFTSNDGGRTFDPASEQLVLRIDRPSSLHYAGTLEFGPDGYLYVGVGDGGSTQFGVTRWRPELLLGSILRLDVDSKEPYAIPPDNPFAGGGGRPEIFAGGLRNPWRFTFDRATGEIWAGDVGEISYEEIDKIEKGKNYGWPTLEGDACFTPRTGCDRTGLAPPVFVYPHAEGASITGGYVYRGKAMPDLVGKYVFGDFRVGRLFALEGPAGNQKASFLNPGGPKPAVSSFGQDASGELYALDWQEGIVYRLVAGEPESGPTLASLLSKTGCVDPTDAKKPAAGLVPYRVNTELWSDGADKERFVAIPDGTTIKVEEDGDLTLPEGSVVVKSFAVAGKLVETRLLLRHPGGEWSGASYEWNDAQTDAVLLETGKEKPLPNGQVWSFPSPAQCFVCHTQGAGITLGLEAMQLNGELRYTTGTTANQLVKLSQIGYLDRPLDPATTKRMPELTSSAPIEDRARAYLHANCSMCHRQDTGTGARLDFRYGLPRKALEGCSPSAFPGLSGTTVISPGKPELSALYLRLTTRDGYQMPPLGTRVVDKSGSGVVADWIRSLDTCGE